MEETFLFLREHDLVNRESLARAAGEATDLFHELNTKIKNAEKRLAEIQVLKKHMVNYRKAKDVFVTYRKSGYSIQFFEVHREKITLHKAAKGAFEQQKFVAGH